MKYAVSNWIFLNEQLEKGFRRLHEIGYKYMELVGEPNNYVLETLKEFCEYYELEIYGLLGNFQWPTYQRDIVNPNVNFRTKAIEYIKSCLEFGNQLGNCKIFTMPAAPRWKLNPLMDMEDEWEHAVESLRKIGKFAEDLDMMVAIEPLNRYETYLIRTAQQAMKLIKDVNIPEVIKVSLNTFHANIEEKNIAQAIRKVGDKLINLHLSDSNRGVIGKGNIDWKSIMRAIKETNYDYYIAVEPYIYESDYYDTAMTPKDEDFDEALHNCLIALKYIDKVT
ncbi:MAG: TIM barrel protein [Candidatus Lokiarchaeota archaeon]|nr:TIM barrel protein [Candidatus Lokiarchaeota archaeon]